MRLLLLFAAVDIMLLPPMSLASIVFQVDMRQWYSVGFSLFRQALWLVAVILLARGGAGLFWVIASRALAGVAIASVFLPFCWRKEFLPRPVLFSWSEARQLLRYGFPMALTLVSVAMYQRIDQVMLHKMVGDQALGPYVIAVQMAELFGALPVALMGSLLPILSQTAHQEDQFRHYLGISYRFLMVVIFAVCALTAPVAPAIVDLFYGREFRATSGLLTVLIWSEVPLFLSVVLSNALVAKGLQRYLPVSTMAGAVTNIALNLVMIPRWGALGASWASVISYCIAGVFLFLAFPLTRGLAAQGLQIALRPFLLALAITVALGFLPLAFWWKLALAASTYSAGAWLTGMVKRSEIARAREFVLGTLA